MNLSISMKVNSLGHIVLGVINILGSLSYLIFLIVVFFRNEVTEQVPVFFLVIGYLLCSIFYVVINFISKGEVASIKKVRDKNKELELKIQQIELRYRLKEVEEK